LPRREAIEIGRHLIGPEQAAASVARAIIDANLYMVLGTADPTGWPWVSPVYYAPTGRGEFLWVSRPDRRHSRNIETRPEVSIVIFDSSAPIDTGNGVYMAATARRLTGDERAHGIDLFSRRSLGHGGRPWGLENLEGEASVHLYQATAIDTYVLEADTDRRIPVSL